MSSEFESAYVTKQWDNPDSVVFAEFKEGYEAYFEDMLKVAFAAKIRPTKVDGELCVRVSHHDFYYVCLKVERRGYKVVVMDGFP